VIFVKITKTTMQNINSDSDDDDNANEFEGDYSNADGGKGDVGSDDDDE